MVVGKDELTNGEQTPASRSGVDDGLLHDQTIGLLPELSGSRHPLRACSPTGIDAGR
jgi:hypothetical protein